jgi:hypothetical protein
MTAGQEEGAVTDIRGLLLSYVGCVRLTVAVGLSYSSTVETVTAL